MYISIGVLFGGDSLVSSTAISCASLGKSIDLCLLWVLGWECYGLGVCYGEGNDFGFVD